MNMTTLSTFTGPISTIAHRRAEQWSRQQATPEKRQQVLLNSLAVSFVSFYLECMGFETDLEASDSLNPVEQTLIDVADLSIKKLGKLECRPVLENTDFVYIPPEVQSNRIGYVVVQISDSLQSAKLLGYVQEVSIDEFPINQLQPLENFLDYLERLEVKTTQSSSQNIVELTRWFEDIFASGWEAIESIFLTEPAWQFRSAEKVRAKLINFENTANNSSVGIVVKVSPDENNCDEIKIIVELHPVHDQEYLPQFIQIMILDEEENAVIEAKAKTENRKIELELSAAIGDSFSIKIALGEVSITENFIL
ncbi:MAG: DUF1822 family protein [Microcoleaceae cyanobacterium]